jgi:HB1, ASXL, restriction endonuclease HTH domain
MSHSKSSDLATIKIGARVRHHADGVMGRIVWANAVAVKIQWDDGEKATWKRAELGTKGLDVLEADEATQPNDADGKQTVERARPEAETIATDAIDGTQPQEAAATVAVEPASPVVEAASTPAAAEVAEAQPAALTEPAAVATGNSESDAAAPADAAGRGTTKQTKRLPSTEPKPARASALDAAAKVLAEEGRPMTCQEMITAMAEKGYWTSPGGKTPASTLYSAILREMQTKAAISRFVKTERGKFARTSAV